jgi:ABC-type transport system involved in cytochrome bd biosynthesis fused ATPase/permease subunit
MMMSLFLSGNFNFVIYFPRVLFIYIQNAHFRSSIILLYCLPTGTVSPPHIPLSCYEQSRREEHNGQSAKIHHRYFLLQ